MTQLQQDAWHLFEEVDAFQQRLWNDGAELIEQGDSLAGVHLWAEANHYNSMAWYLCAIGIGSGTGHNLLPERASSKEGQ